MANESVIGGLGALGDDQADGCPLRIVFDGQIARGTVGVRT